MQNKIKNILFRADSSSTIGTGHIMRDLVLAKQYLKVNITFAMQELKSNMSYKIKKLNKFVKIILLESIKFQSQVKMYERKIINSLGTI